MNARADCRVALAGFLAFDGNVLRTVGAMPVAIRHTEGAFGDAAANHGLAFHHVTRGVRDLDGVAILDAELLRVVAVELEVVVVAQVAHDRAVS